MQYLTYEDYQRLGGELDSAAFERNIDRACAMIDIRTHDRLAAFESVPILAKVVCYELVNYISTYTTEKPFVSSKSQTAGGVSESETYAVKTTEDFAQDLDRIFEPLASLKTKNGISILYRGAMS